MLQQPLFAFSFTTISYEDYKNIMLNGIKNFLQMINDNWTTLLVIFGLITAIIKKLKAYAAKTEEEKILIAKEQFRNTVLKLITDAERDYDAWNMAGELKRAQVIDAIYAKYPILSKAVNQKELLHFIDKEIDNALQTLRTVMEQNQIETSEE